MTKIKFQRYFVNLKCVCYFFLLMLLNTVKKFYKFGSSVHLSAFYLFIFFYKCILTDVKLIEDTGFHHNILSIENGEDIARTFVNVF